MAASSRRPRAGVQSGESTPLLRELEPVPTNDSAGPLDSRDQGYGSSNGNGNVTRAGARGADGGAAEDNTYTEGELERQTSLEGRLQQYQGIPELKKRMKYIFPALAIGVFLSAADQTIIVASSSRISSELNALNKASWIAMSYFLTLASFQPLYGKLSDIFSRKSCLLFGYCVFGLGCLFCGLARTIDELILARAFAGIGGSAMTTVVSILLSDAIPLKERGTWQGYINVIYASGAGCGAPLGGLLADSIGWRWSFIGQTPFCLLAFICVALVLKTPAPADGADEAKKEHWTTKLRRIDFLGAAALVCAIVLLLVAMDRGSNVAWRDRWALIPLCISLPLFAAFLLVETKVAAEPFAPGHIIFERSLFAAYMCNFFSFAGWLAALFYIPLYLQAVTGVSASRAGVLMLPSIFAGVTGSVTGGLYMQWSGRYYWLTVMTYANLCVGLVVILLCSGLVVTSTVGVVFGMVICSYSNGIGVTSSLIALISNAARDDQAMATACSYMFRSLGSTIGLSLSATAANQTLRNSLRASLGSGAAAERIALAVRHDIRFVKTLSPHLRDVVEASYATSTRAAFVLQLALVTGSAVAAWLIREKPLSK